MAAARLGNFPGTGPEPDDLTRAEETVEELLAKCLTRRTSASKPCVHMTEAETKAEAESMLKSLTRLLYLGTKEGMKAHAVSKNNSQNFSLIVPPTALATVNQHHYVSSVACYRRIVNRELTPGHLSRRDFRRGWVDVVLEMVCNNGYNVYT